MSTSHLSAQPSKNAWYALRRTLPLWSFSENLTELIETLPRYAIDELIIKVDTEEFSHGHPSVQWLKAYMPHLFEIKEALEKLGIRYSLNPWVTLGHADRGRKGVPDAKNFQPIVGHDGTECAMCACPIGQDWRDYLKELWTLYASTHPHVLWVEDDIRTFNHAPVRYGCFCPLHLAEFSRRIGRMVTREELVSAILQPGTPHPWRAEYLEMNADLMIGTVRFIAETVHTVSPHTSLGLMSSGPRQHCLEGRRWQEFAGALADDRTLYSRPPLMNYNEGTLRGFYYSQDSIKITRHCLPIGTIEQTEVENFPFTRYSKSVTTTFLQMAISFAYGSHGVTMNLFDHCGTPLEEEPWYGVMLGEKKPYLQGLAHMAQKPGRYRGVRLLHHDAASHLKELNADSQFQNLCEDGLSLMEAFETHGIPTTYEASSVVAVAGQNLRSSSDETIRALLAEGLFLDGQAAKVLFDRGFGPDIGLQSIEPPVRTDHLGDFGAEEYFNESLGGEPRRYLTLLIGSGATICLARPAPEAHIISSIVDPDERRHHPAMLAFENSSGGRVITHLLDWSMACDVGFSNASRHRQLHNAMAWLYRDNPPLTVAGGVYPLTFRKDLDDGSTLLGLFNLSLDAWPNAELSCADRRRIRQLRTLGVEGMWEKDFLLSHHSNGEHHLLRYNGTLAFSRPLFITITWEI